jgi:hypothetical protein
MNGVRTHNEIQVPYDHDHDGIAKNIEKKKEWKNILPASFDIFPGCIYIKLFICKSPNKQQTVHKNTQASFRFPRGNNLIMDLENIMYILFSLFFSE